MTDIPEKTGFINFENIFFINIKRMQLMITSSKRIIIILKLASIEFSMAQGFDEKSFIKNARASFVSILLKKLNPTSFLIVFKILPTI